MHLSSTSSVAASWVLPDEDSTVANAARRHLATDGAVVPPLWHLEVRNVLLASVRRRRISPRDMHDRLEALGELPILDDASTDLRTALSLAEAHRLSFYDAVYLELACRRAMALATLDGALSQAAVAENLPTIAERD
ncbi:MAG: type II toxin-antitoxin system VapC family toxin [Gammaproteobacteria bacterium]|nr:type II toxin-antitoxin system VapC family toxin [Gammaproteobacteria bacterium]